MEVCSLSLAFPALAPKPLAPADQPPVSSSQVVSVDAVVKCLGALWKRPLVQDLIVGLVFIIILLWARSRGYGQYSLHPYSPYSSIYSY